MIACKGFSLCNGCEVVWVVCPKNWKQKYKTKEKFCKITQELLLLYNFSQIFCQITQQLLLLYTFDGIFLSNQHFISCDIKTKVSLTKKIPSNHTTTLITLCIFTNFLSNQHCISCDVKTKVGLTKKFHQITQQLLLLYTFSQIFCQINTLFLVI